jgi:hypothetical protein
MKKLFFIIFLTSCLSPLTFSQWWVRGGNLIWPYGNVDITKGSLNLTGDLNTKGNAELTVSNQINIKDTNGNKIGVISGSPGNSLSVVLGDVDGAANNVKLTINDDEIAATSLLTSKLSLLELLLTFPVSNLLK